MEPPAYNGIMSSFDYLENCNRRIFNHGWVNFPLAYTQVIQVSLFDCEQYSRSLRSMKCVLSVFCRMLSVFCKTFLKGSQGLSKGHKQSIGLYKNY